MADGGGLKATLELLLHFHGFRNIDLRSRGQYCVEVVAYPASCPNPPGVPIRTFYDASARRSMARGVAVSPCEGDMEHRGMSCTSQGGLPAYATSVLSIRFTNEQVQLNEGCLFRLNIDADWVETEVIAIGCRLMNRALPEGDGEAAPTEDGDAGSRDTQPAEEFKEVGKVTLHAKCAASRGGLHRYHPLVFPQPHLCQLDVTLHMALTSMNHSGGPAGLSAIISAAAFPSEDSGVPPAPRPYNSPARSRAPAATPTQERRHARSASAGRLLDGSGRAAFGVIPLRPRFMTPGRARKRTIVQRSRSASFSAGVASLGPTQAPPTARQHRMPLSKAALEAASTAAGLSAALGYAAGKLNGGRSSGGGGSGSDGDDEKSSRDVYRAAELLYSRHALGLRWSRGALEVAKAAAMATEDPKAGADKVLATAVSATVLAAKRRSKGKSTTSRRIKSSQETEPSPTKVFSKAANATAPGDGDTEDSSEARGMAVSNGFKEETTAAAAVVVLKNMWNGEAQAAHRKPPPPPPCKEKMQDADVDAVTEAPSNATPKSDVDEGVDVRQDLKAAAAMLAPRPREGLMGGDKGAEKREGHATGRGSAKAKTTADLVAWTWGENSPTVKVDIPKTPLPSDLRQLSWLIHTWLTEESAACSRAWSAFAKATFERGRRGLSKMREEWLRDTTRAWSGQCLETLSVERGDLLRLNKALLDPEGFLQLRARAGVRLKRRASPIGSRSRGGASYRRENAGSISTAPTASAAAAVRVGSEAELKLPNGLARLQALEKALSVSGSWVEGSGAGFVIATSSSSPSSPSSASTSSLTSPTAPTATVTTSHSAASRSGGGSGLDTEKNTNDEIYDEDDEPPLLDALERRGEALRCAAALAALSTTPRKRSSSLVMSWGAVSPWNYGGGGAQPGGRPEQVSGWLSRLAAAGGGGGGSSASSPTNSNSGRAASFSLGSGHGKESGGKTGADAKCLTQSEMAVAAADYPPPPQSLLPVFNRELHGFDHAASEEDRWGELPFLVVESWGGLDDDILTAPCSPILLRHETGSTATVRSRQPSPSRKPPFQPAPPLPNLPPLPPAPLATSSSVADGIGSTVSGANSFRVSSSCDESAPTEEADTNKEQARKVVKTKRGEGENAAPEVTSAATASTGPPPLLPPRARSISMDAPIAAAVTAAMSPPKSSRGTDRLNGSSPGSEKSIWDHPSTGPRQPRGPKFSAAKRRLPRPPGLTNLNIPPAGASGGGGVGFSERDRRDSSDSVSVLSARSGDWAAGSGGGGGGIAGGSSDNYDEDDDDFWSGSDNFSSGSETRRNERRRSREVARRSTKRAEIRKRMWGRRPSWTTALLAPSAPSASGSMGAAAAAARPRMESGTNHLIVFVHGLGGRPADMALMRGYLQTLMPAAELMVSTSLQDMRKDNLGVEAMGRKLAEEVHAHIMRFCPYLGNSTGPTPTDDAPTANGGSLPLSPVTPMRYPRGDMRAGSNVGGSMDGDGAGGKLSTPLRNRGGGGGASPAATRGGVHASPGAAAAARAISEEIAATGHKITVTPSRPTPTRQRAKGASTGGDWSRGGGNKENKGMLSFVCFSMGGLIARSALLEAAMAPYLSSLQCFVTLACPHLGQTSTPLSFFKTGAWAVRKLTGLRVLHELDLDDADNVRDTTLYRLNLSPGLEQFRTVVFAANPRDGFVPLHSASVRFPPEASSSSGGGGAGSSSSSGSTKKGGKGKKDAVSKEMARMLMSKMDERVNRVVRMTVDAPRRKQAQGALDSVIGRAGHMCFIDSAQVAWLISLALLPFMEEQGS